MQNFAIQTPRVRAAVREAVRRWKAGSDPQDANLLAVELERVLLERPLSRAH